MKLNTISNLRRGAFLGLALLLCASGASAQVFKWVDANGKTHFSDTPPPADAKPAKLKGGSFGPGNTADFPYALANAARNHPVTLYSDSACTGCDAGRAHLRSRGIPFAEKTVSTEADLAKLKAVGGNGSVPYLTVGGAKMAGFEAGAWDGMLNNAQYPATKMLPASYQYPPAVAAAPKAAEPDRDAARRAAAEQAAKDRAATAAPPSPSAPPGFQF
jgi:glutaredoxin